MAGGPVRDILCGIQPNDIDFASNANPQQMINIMRFSFITITSKVLLIQNLLNRDKENIRLITTPSGLKSVPKRN